MSKKVFKLIVTIILIVIISISFIGGYRELTYEIENYLDLDIAAIDRIEIPVISLREKLSIIPINSKRINGVVIFEEYGRPDIVHSNTIIGAHSGAGINVYFNKLDVIDINDLFYIYYKDKIYEYLVYDTLEVDEDDLSILNNIDRTIATLMTCKRSNPTKRVIVIGELIDTID